MGVLRAALAWPWRYLQDTHTTPGDVVIFPSVQPVLDVGAQWPPRLGFYTETFSLANGTNTIILPEADSLTGALNPGAWPQRPTPVARRWLSLGFLYAEGAAAKNWQLSFLPQPGSAFPLAGHTLMFYDGSTLASPFPMPLIRTSKTTAGFNWRGVEHSVLVPNPALLYLQGVMGVAEEEVVVSGVFVDGFAYEPLPDPWA